MAKTVAHRNLGGPGTPNDIRQLRESRFEMLEELGYPVVHKHRWNERDMREGLVEPCPLDHDELYGGQGATWDPVCFGTGYVGGYADPTVVWITLNDTPTNVITPLPSGILELDNHPQLTAPWLPEMGDGDMIILADFDPMTWEVLDMHERYILQDVTPYTIRGPKIKTQSTIKDRHRIQQNANVDKLPWGHHLYNVPLVFDPSIIPGVLGEAELRVAVRVVGAESQWKASSHSANVRVVAQEQVGITNYSTAVRVNGVADDDVIIHL
jgi:hypothetical protein